MFLRCCRRVVRRRRRREGGEEGGGASVKEEEAETRVRGETCFTVETSLPFRVHNIHCGVYTMMKMNEN